MTAAFIVRPFGRGDIPELLRLMRALAVFEGYADRFAVTARDLEERGLGPAPQFAAHVAALPGGELAGMAVAYTVPYTFDLRPVAVLKELYVDAAWRGGGAGAALFAAVRRWARAQGCARLRWDVLEDNHAAMRFYRAQGGTPFRLWQAWHAGLD